MNSNMKRIIVNFVLVILAFIVQTCIFPLLPFLAVYPNLMVILVFSFGFIRGSAWRSFGVPYACLYLDGLCKRNLYKILL